MKWETKGGKVFINASEGGVRDGDTVEDSLGPFVGGQGGDEVKQRSVTALVMGPERARASVADT